MTTTPKQLSRVAGVPRLKLPIWKAAAAHFFQGKPDPSREEQRNNGKKTKVALLRELAASDPEVKSWVIRFATDLRGRDARQVATEQGFVMPEKLGFVPLFPGDRPDLSVLARTVICMEKQNAAELLEKLVTLYPDSDPPEVAEREAAALAEVINMPFPAPVLHGCNYCGFNNGPATRILNGAHYCDRHDGKPTGPQFQPPPDPQSPAAYINSNFGKDPVPALDPTNPAHNRALALKALGEAYATVPHVRGGTDYGPTEPKK